MADRSPAAFAVRWTPLLAGIGVPVAWFAGGANAVAGFLIGSALSWLSLWAGTLVVRNSIDESQTKVSAQSRLQLLLLVKLPILAIVTFFTSSLGLGAVIAFLVGYFLVYLALVLGALSRSSPATDTDDVR
ncbi:MAG: hypothetical protein M3R13_01985 [Armatimonadota bacterium]|nr:hypothetical protein [Armatimonadota bacterium]